MVEFNPKAKRERRSYDDLGAMKAENLKYAMEYMKMAYTYQIFTTTNTTIHWNIEDDGKYEF